MNIIIPGGFEANFTLGFVKGLAANGLELCVVSCDETAARLTAAGIPNVNLLGSLSPNRPVWLKVTNLVRYYLRLLALLLRHRGATVHFTGIFRNKLILWEGLFLNLCFRLLARRYVYTSHNVLPHNRRNSRFFRSVYRALYSIPHVILVHTRRAQQQLTKEFGVPEHKIRLSSIGLNEEMRLTALTRTEARQRLGFREPDQVLLFFGKIDEYKGVDLLLEAFAALALPSARLLLAGAFPDCAYRERILSAIDGSPNKSDIRLHEDFIPNDEVELFFKASDVLVLPYRSICQSGLVFLAMRFGIPVVATDVGSLREYVEPDLGVVAATNDAVGLADALRRFFAARRLYLPDRIVAKGDRYRWENVCKALVPLYQPQAA